MNRKLASNFKTLLAASAVLFGLVPAGHAATIVLYDFQEPDPTGLFSNAPETTAANITAGAWSIRDGVLLTAVGNVPLLGAAVSGLGWGAADPGFPPFIPADPEGNRYRFQITVAPGFSLNLNSVSFDDQRFDLFGFVGPTTWSLDISGATVLSGQSTDPTGDGWTSRTVGFGPTTGLTGSFFVDLWAFGANTNLQPWNVDNFKLEGTVVPLPAAVWLLGSALVGLIGISRRRNV